MAFKSIFPFNQEIIAEYSLHSEDEIMLRLEGARKAYLQWNLSSYTHRADLFLKLAALLREEKPRLALLITMEMGKTKSEAETEVEKCAKCCEYYAENGWKALEKEVISSDASLSYVTFQSVGAVFAIMPWNFPFWQVFRYAVPTLLAGNVSLLKHAPNVCGCALAIEDLFRKAGFEKGVFQSLIVDVQSIEKILQSDIVQGVTLTGSEYAGSSVASLAGKHIKKTVMELGGSDPFIVLEGALLEKAAKAAVQSRMQNAGQSCIAAKRFLVHEKVKEEFVQHVRANLLQLEHGNPLDEKTKMGPVARIDLADQLEKQYYGTLEKGAKSILNYERDGCNVSPLLLTDLSLASPAFLEETFGPLMAIFSIKNEDHAVELANQTRYGLGASVWTEDLEKAQQLALQINSGAVFINAIVKSDPHLPFGGVKKSGYGRELSHFGMREFLNIKTVYID